MASPTDVSREPEVKGLKVFSKMDIGFHWGPFLEEIERGAGTHFDPAIVGAFKSVLLSSGMAIEAQS